MSTEKVSQQLFMKVKQRLDYYRLPATFPFEATPLLNKLLNLLDNKGGENSQGSVGSFETESVTGAMKHQIARVTKENNELHMNLIVAKEQIQSLEHNVFKYQSGKLGEGKQLQKCLLIKQKRQDELVQELRDIRYKYNELMDFLHEDPRADREYIKRLMKHKQVNVEDSKQQERPVGAKGQSENNYTIKQLQFKVKNRQDEIKRLHKLIEYDGTNMNKLIKNFNDDLVKKQLKNADSKINYLEESYDKIKKQNQSMRKKNGLKQALRSEVQKCHQVIDTLKKENEKLRRNHQEQNFDHQKKTSQNERNIGKVKSDKASADKIIQQNQVTINDLHKKIQFLNKQVAEASEAAKNAQEYIAGKEDETSNFQRKLEEQRVFYEYELDTLKKRVYELQADNDQHLLKGKQLVKELELTMRESQLKDESIINLQKIVNELIRKNSLLSDHTAGTLEESLKQSAELEYKVKLNEFESKVRQLLDQRAQLEAALRSIEHRFGQVSQENQRFKYENGVLKSQIQAKQSYVMKAANQLDELKYIIKKEQTEHSRTAAQAQQISRVKQSMINELKAENERLNHQQKALKLRIKDMQIKISEEEGVWEVTRERLDEKQSKIKQLQKLLTDSVQQTKVLTNNLNELDHQNHELTREKHRLLKKYEELKKDENEFKNTSFKNYEAAISQNLNEMTDLRKQLLKLAQSNEILSSRFEEANNLVKILEREKQLSEFDKVSLTRDVEILKTRLLEMQEVERTLVLENESLRTLAKSM